MNNREIITNMMSICRSNVSRFGGLSTLATPFTINDNPDPIGSITISYSDVSNVYMFHVFTGNDKAYYFHEAEEDKFIDKLSDYLNQNDAILKNLYEVATNDYNHDDSSLYSSGRDSEVSINYNDLDDCIGILGELLDDNLELDDEYIRKGIEKVYLTLVSTRDS